MKRHPSFHSDLAVKPVAKWQRGLVYLLCGLINVQPVLANVVVSGGNTTVTNAVNGVEVVNIATPNGKGLSHNQYQQFDVDPSGLILNNSTEHLGVSQLGGILQNNPNLTGGAASVILNEVTGANASQLQGYTEVFGSQANVILANPYGITCSGCGFINTPRVTLSTGAPDITNGEVAGFDVAEGAVTVEGLGLDATRQSYFDIISRTAELNAAINAKELTVITGQNNVSYQTNLVTEKAATGGDKPQLAIDSSSLGGMYAGRITLIATEDGVGVNVGNLAATQGKLELTADGKIQLADASSNSDITISSSDTVALTGKQFAKESLSVSADNISTTNATLASEKKVSLNANNDVQLNSSTIASGVDKDGNRLTDGDIKLTADHTQLTDSRINAVDTLTSQSANITLDSGSAINSKTVNLTTLDTLNNQGKLSATESTTISGDNVTLTGEGMVSGGNALTVNSSSLTNSNQLLSSGDNRITVTGKLTNTGTGKITGRNSRIEANQIENQGWIQATTDVDITSASLQNQGTITAANNVTLNQSGELNNQSLIYAGNNGNFYSNSLINTGQLLSGNDILIARDATKQRSNTLTNSSGTIEAMGGNIGIYADMVANKRTVLDIETGITQDFGTSIPDGGRSNIVIEHDSPYAPEYRRHFRSAENGAGGDVTQFRVLEKDAKPLTFDVFVESGRLRQASERSEIKAGENIYIDADMVVNNTSQIAGNNVVLKARTLSNEGYELFTYTTRYIYKLDRGSYHQLFRGSNAQSANPVFRYSRVDIQRTKSGSNGIVNADITATNSLNLNVTKKANNSTIRANADPVVLTTTDEQIKSIENDSQSLSELANSANPTGALLPEGNNGLFIYSPDPEGSYLIETSPALTNIGTYLGSEYFQNKLGFNPNRDVTFLGDAFYDTRVVTQAIFEQTGRRYLNDSVGSDLSQMQQLMDAAAQQQSSLNLSAGIALTPEQVANLTQDILWYEEIEVNGRKVLAPKLYLAKVTKQNIVGGARLAGNATTINTGDFDNSGTVTAKGNLDIISQQGIDNIGGSLIAKGDTTLLAKQDITNISGTIRGDKVTIVSTDGSLINKTSSEQLSVDSAGNLLGKHTSNSQITRTLIGDTASIQAEGDLTIGVGKKFISTGGKITAKNKVDIQAGEGILLSSIQKQNYTRTDTGTVVTSSKTDYQDNQIKAGSDLILKSGGNLIASGGELLAGNKVDIDVAGDMTLLANQTAMEESSIASRKKDIIKNTRQQGVQISAGDEITIDAGNNVNLFASELNAGKDIEVDAGGTFSAVAETETDYERHYKKKSGLFGSSTSDVEIQSRTAKGTQLAAGGDVIITSKANQTHQASELKADKDIRLTSTEGKLSFTAAEESYSYRKETKKSGLMVKSKGKGETRTTQKLTSMQSGGEINFSSALGFQVDHTGAPSQLAQSLDALPKESQQQWMALLKDNPDVDWNKVNEAYDSWSYSHQSLSGPAAAIIAIAVTIASAGAAAGAGAAIAGSTVGATSAAATTVAAMGTAATSTLITQATLSLINNGGDIGATLKDLGSSDKAKMLATAMLTAGAMAGFDVATGVSDGTINPETGAANYTSVDSVKAGAGNPNILNAVPSITPETLLDQAARSGIQAGVDSAVNGTDFEDSFTNSLRGAIANNIGAIAANKIGDIGEQHGLENGGITKTTLHAVSQGAVAELAGGEFAAGAAAGAATELAGEALGNSGLTEQTQTDVAGLIGATAGVVATGDAEGAYTGQNAGSTVHKFNHLNHQEASELAKAEGECGRNPASDSCGRAEELRALDTQRNIELVTACNGPDTAKCAQLTEFALKNQNSYKPAIVSELKESDAQNYRMPERLQELYLTTEQVANDPTGQKAETVAAIMDGVVDFMPVAGDVKGYVEAQTGMDYLLATVGLLPGAGDFVKSAADALNTGNIKLAQEMLAKAKQTITENPKLLEYKPEVADKTKLPVVVDEKVAKNGDADFDDIDQAVIPSDGGAKSKPDNYSNYEIKDYSFEPKFWEKPQDIGGRTVYKRNDLFDANYVSSWKEKGKTVTGTNKERMATGRAPIGYDGKSVELHHLTQKEVNGLTSESGALAEVGSVSHSKNTKVLHIPVPRDPNKPAQTIPKYPSFRKENDGTLSQQGKDFGKYQKEYWQQRANDFE